MGYLTDTFDDDAEFAFTNPDDHAETVLITFLNRTTRTINVVIDHQPPVPFGENAQRVQMVIELANNATTGITFAELNSGGMTITCQHPPGAVAKAYQIHRPTDGSIGDSAMLVVTAG